jgi:hypothetical protein
MLEKCPDNKKSIHYLKRYIKFIFKCIEYNENNTLDYTEKHHILPKANNLWPQYSDFNKFEWNKAILTARQHFLAHYMLAKIYNGAMWYAASFILYVNGVKINSRIHEELKKQKANNTLVYDYKKAWEKRAVTLQNKYGEGIDNAFKAEPVKDKIKLTLLSKYGVDNCSKSEEIKEKKRKTTLINYGVDHHNKLDRYKQKLSKTFKETHKNMEAKQCPYCNKKIKGSNFNRWHNENCKNNPNRNPPIYTCTVCGFKSENKGMISRFHNDNCKHRD